MQIQTQFLFPVAVSSKAQPAAVVDGEFLTNMADIQLNDGDVVPMSDPGDPAPAEVEVPSAESSAETSSTAQEQAVQLPLPPVWKATPTAPSGKLEATESMQGGATARPPVSASADQSPTQVLSASTMVRPDAVPPGASGQSMADIPADPNSGQMAIDIVPADPPDSLPHRLDDRQTSAGAASPVSLDNVVHRPPDAIMSSAESGDRVARRSPPWGASIFTSEYHGVNVTTPQSDLDVARPNTPPEIALLLPSEAIASPISGSDSAPAQAVLPGVAQLATFSPAPPGTPPSAGPPPHPAGQLADAIVQVVRSGGADGLELTLRPDELGHLRFEISSRGERLHINLFVERPEAMDLLRRNIDLLMADLRQAGFGQTSLSFGQWTKGEDHSTSPAEPEEGQASQEGSAAAEPRPAYGGDRLVADGRLHLRL